MSDTSETDIPIWVDGMVKYVTGLTRRTTCDDVTYALMELEWNGDVDVGAYAIFEGWRGVERPLKGRTKILKVWRAWGDEQDSVVLTLRRLSDMFRFASCESLRSKRLRKPHSNVRERERQHKRYEQKDDLATHRRDNAYPHKHYRRNDVLTSSRLYEARDSRAHGALSRELNNNIKHRPSSSSKFNSKESLTHVCDKIHGDRNRCTKHKAGGNSGDENNNNEVAHSSRHVKSEHAQSQITPEMVPLILAQQRQIQEQMRRTQEVDAQIEHYENMLHQIRMQDHGRDYVQKAYIRDLSGSEESSLSSSSADEKGDLMKAADLQAVLFSESAAEMAAGLSGKDLEEYLNIADELLALDDRLNTNHHAIQELSMRIEEESVRDLSSEISQFNESSLLVSPPSIHSGMDQGDICLEKEKLATEGHEELLDTKDRLEHTCWLSSAQQKQIQELEHQIDGFDIKLKTMKQYVEKLASELNESSPDEADIGNYLHETLVNSLNDSVQFDTNPRTSTPYVPGIARQKKFVDEFLASPKLQLPSPKHIHQMPQSSNILCSNPNQECSYMSVYPKYNSQIPQCTYSSYYSLDPECSSSLCTTVSGSNLEYSSEDSTRFSQDSREFSSPSSLVRQNGWQVAKHSSYAKMELFSTTQESTLNCDSNSDTGLSSLHSDDAVPILETLV